MEMINLYWSLEGKIIRILNHEYSSFPIVLTGNQNVKIGQFNISIVSSFANQGNDDSK